MKNLTNYLTGFVLMIFFLFLIGVKTTEAASTSYSVSPVIPENQKDKNLTYFDLTTSPGMEQKLLVKITNNSDNPIKLEPQVNIAKTNSNGVIDYQSPSIESDETLKYEIDKLVVPDENTIELEPHTEKEIAFSIKMPLEEFDGQLIGGIVFKDLNQETSESGISNVYSYVVGIVLHGQSELENNVLELGDVYANQVNYRNVITADIRNPEAKIISQLEVQTKITKKNSTKVMYQETKDQLMMAPNSIMAFPTSLNDETLKAGEYTIDIQATDGTETWTFKRDFTIDGSEAKKLNKQAVDLKQDYTVIYITIIVILVLVLGGLIFYAKKNQRKNIN